MDFEHTIEARYIRRVNRFVAELALDDGTIVNAHVANTGRMTELLVQGVRALIRKASNSNRKTEWDFLAVDYEGHWVCLMAAWANDMMEAWLRAGYIDGFDHATFIKREKKVGTSRFDFYLEQDDERWLFEVKSVNYVLDGHAFFPDAPTSRGKRHVEALMALQKEGWHVAVFFVTMGQPVVDVTFNEKNDPDFAKTMRQAISEGVTVKAFASEIAPQEVRFMGERAVI